MKSPLENQPKHINEILSLSWKAALIVGGLIILSYCFLENILPSGLSFSDSFLLVYLCFAFGFIVLVGVAYGTFFSIWVLRFSFWIGHLWMKHKEAKSKPSNTAQPPISSKESLNEDPGTIVAEKLAVISPFNDNSLCIASALSTLLFILIVWVAERRMPTDVRPLSTLFYFIFFGLVLLSIFGTNKVKSWPIIVRIRNVAIAVIFMLPVFHPSLLNITFIWLGVRSTPGQLVTISDASHTKLVELAKIHRLKISFCKLPASGRWGSTDVRVIWHGIGRIAYVKIIDKESSVLVPLTDDVEILKGMNTQITCHDSNTDNN